MSKVGAANICCGVHAGSRLKTRETLQMAQRYGVLVGAHPGIAQAGGRGVVALEAAEFQRLLEQQIGEFLALAAELGVEVSYVKLHGSLYHLVELDESFRQTYLSVLQSVAPGLGLFCLAGGSCAEAAREAGLRVWAEAFADRGYHMEMDGRLVPRGQAGDLLDWSTALERIQNWRATGLMTAVTGDSFPLQADTLCVHADSPDALQLLTAL